MTNKIGIPVIAFGVLVAGLLLYRSCGAGNNLNVDPHARQEIEKAKQR